MQIYFIYSGRTPKGVRQPERVLCVRVCHMCAAEIYLNISPRARLRPPFKSHMASGGYFPSMRDGGMSV